MHALPRIRPALAAAALCLMLTASAQAAVVTPIPGGVAVVDRARTADRLTLGFPAPETVRVHSASGPLAMDASLLTGHGGVACRVVDAATVLCRPFDPKAGLRLRVNTGGGDDTVRFARPSTSKGGILAPTVDAGPGADVVVADGTIEGGPGDDVLRARGRVPAALFGGPGDDVLAGAMGDDALLGGAGNDRLVDLHGVNVFRGGPGRDTAVIRRHTGSDTATSNGDHIAAGVDVIAGDVERITAR